MIGGSDQSKRFVARGWLAIKRIGDITIDERVEAYGSPAIIRFTVRWRPMGIRLSLGSTRAGSRELRGSRAGS